MVTFYDEKTTIEHVVPTVFKAMELRYAHELIEMGRVCFSNIECFARDEHPERGDRNEGKTVLVRNGRRCTADYLVPSYVWCCTMDSNPCRVMNTWSDRDCVVQVLDALEFARRIAGSLPCQCPDVGPLAMGPVVYTKTKGGHEHVNWVDGLFQKDQEFDSQKEFRFALPGRTGGEAKCRVFVDIEPCTEVFRIAWPTAECLDVRTR